MLNLEMNIIVVSILLLLYVKVIKNIDQQMKNIVFSRLLLFLLIISVLEIVVLCLNGKDFTGSRQLLRFILSIKYSLTALISCYWCHYLMCESVWLNKNLFNTRIHFALVVPACILIIMSIISFWQDWIFTFNSKGYVIRGKYHFVQGIITYAYFTIASTSVLISIFKPENRNHLFTQIMLVVLPFVLGLIHLFKPSINTVWPGLTVILLVRFVDFQEEQVFIDSLTGLNNRRSFDKFLTSILNEHGVFAKSFYLYMIDLNHFKTINDTFGHTEGDSALINAGAIFKSVCAGKNAFLSRFGGDEFAIIYPTANAEKAWELKNELLDAFRKFNVENSMNKPYAIEISVGYTAVPKKTNLSSVQIINMADLSLYGAKRSAESDSAMEEVVESQGIVAMV